MNLRLDTTAESIPTAACTVRRGVPADAADLANFAARTFTDTYGDYNTPANLAMHLEATYNVAQQTRELGDADVATLLAHQYAQLVAYAQVRRAPPPPCVGGAAPVELLRFYVDKSHHGAGVAQRLFEEARCAATALGGATLWLKVWERNPRAIAFYRKCGFVDVGVADFFVGTDRQTDRVLAMDLRDSQTHTPS